ncbi:hypothetical protein R1flu_016716 [Riccia fluitans]|uniref:Uncharacterized protein n=1 Tax=Riccia fluitans TaxID=41844 RepID=A0ABD1YMS5_9MARC
MPGGNGGGKCCEAAKGKRKVSVGAPDNSLKRKIPPHVPPCDPLFRPQPGDIIIRSLPVAPLSTELVLRVMGLIKIYKDDYYFVHEHGGTQVVRFTFRSRDKILRVGQFMNPLYSWKFEERAALYLYWKPDPDEPGAWHNVCEQTNRIPYYAYADDHFLSTFAMNKLGHVISEGSSRFQPMEGDFVTHTMEVQAPDRPWGQSFELRIIPPAGARPEQPMFGINDVLIRVRLATGLATNIVDQMPDEVIMSVLDLVDSSVPMYVMGFLCLGSFDGGSNHRWRYLGYDHQIFRDNRNIRRDQLAELIRAYPSCPLTVGDVMVNFDEVLHDRPGEDPTSGAMGHIKICCRDVDGDPNGSSSRENKPEDLPGTMIVRFGRFFSDLNDYHTGLHGPVVMANFEPRAGESTNRFRYWAVTRPSHLIIHDGMSADRTGWIDACMRDYNLLPFNRAEDGVTIRQPPVPSSPATELYQQMDFQIFEFRTKMNLILRREEKKHKRLGEGVNTPSERFQLDADDKKIHLLPDESRVLQIVDYLPETKYSFINYERAEVRDGDHIIRYDMDLCRTVPGRWIMSVELYGCSRLPSEWAQNPEASLILSFKGRDVKVLPSVN